MHGLNFIPSLLLLLPAVIQNGANFKRMGLTGLAAGTSAIIV